MQVIEILQGKMSVSQINIIPNSIEIFFFCSSGTLLQPVFI